MIPNLKSITSKNLIKDLLYNFHDRIYRKGDIII
jgi:hypothetical protein